MFSHWTNVCCLCYRHCVRCYRYSGEQNRLSLNAWYCSCQNHNGFHVADLVVSPRLICPLNIWHCQPFLSGNTFWTWLLDIHFVFSFFLTGPSSSDFFTSPSFSPQFLNVGVPQGAVLCLVLLLSSTCPLRNLLHSSDWDMVLCPQMYVFRPRISPKPQAYLSAYWPFTSRPTRHLKLNILRT